MASLAASPTAGNRDVFGQPANRRANPEIDRVELRGMRSVPVEQARLLLVTRASYCRLPPLAPVCRFVRGPLLLRKHHLEPGELERDAVSLRGLYWQRGFREAQVDTIVQPSRHGVAITFDVREGLPTLVDTVIVERVSGVLEPETVRRAVPLRSGAPLDLASLDTALLALRDQLWDAGYANAVLEPDVRVDDRTRRAVVRIAIDPRSRTRVASVEIEGNERLSDAALRGALTFRPGSDFRRGDVLASQRYLYQSLGVASAVIIVPPGRDGAGDSLARVQVRIQERRPRQIGLVAGLNTTEFVQAGARAGLFALGGGRWQLELRGAVGNLFARQLEGAGPFADVTNEDPAENAFLRPTWQGSTELTRLWAGSPRNRFTVGAFGHRRSEPAVFVDRGVGAFASFTREMAERAPLSLGYRIERAAVDAGDVFFCQSYGLCDAPTVTTFRDPRRLASVTVNGWLDRSNDGVTPSRGYTLRLEMDHASPATGSEYRHARAEAEATVYRPIGSWVLAGRARAGWARAPGEILHPRALFYAGGAASVRGYGENQLGPRVLRVRREALLAGGCTEETILDGSCDPDVAPPGAFSPRPVGATTLLEGTVELRVPLAGKVAGVLFADGATLGEAAGPTTVKGVSAFTPGAGLRFETNVGTLRLDAGWQSGRTERLPVVVETRGVDGAGRVTRLATEKRWDPIEDTSGMRGALRRVTLHFVLGHAF